MRYAAAVIGDGSDEAGRFVEVRRTEVDDGRVAESGDSVVREEPLEIRLAGVPLAVVMRTPGHDEDLTWGFLFTERIVEDPSSVQTVRHCTTVEAPEAEDNIMQVVLAPEVEVDLARLRRNLYASSSCGICGKATIENVLVTAPPLDDPAVVEADVLYGLPAALRRGQDVFDRTGGLHAAGIFTLTGEAVVVREDVGRHNAVDKTIGWALRRGLDLRGHVMQVSGRLSYEITQKALAARIPILAAVSAPTSLAVELALEADMTLVGFLRDRRMCVYSGVDRVRS